MVSQSRAISGPWQAAKTPTSLAIGDLLHFRRCGSIERMQFRDEFSLRHASDLKIKPQQICIDAWREYADVVFKQRFAHFGPDLIAIDDGRSIGAIIRGKISVVLQVKEHFAQPIVC